MANGYSAPNFISAAYDATGAPVPTFDDFYNDEAALEDVASGLDTAVGFIESLNRFSPNEVLYLAELLIRPTPVKVSLANI